jgi:hypothetical protein
MVDKVDKPKKKAKPKKDDKGVLAALPSTRPERIGGRRSAAGNSTTSSAAKRSSATKKASTPRATAARRKAAAPRTFEPTPAAESAAGAADERAAGAVPLAETPRKPREERTYPRPRPVREGAPGIGTAGYREQPSQESARPSGVELATTAVKAAGEVAQFGLTIGGQVLKRVVDRLPKP